MKTAKEYLNKHLPSIPQLGIVGSQLYDNTGRSALPDVINMIEEILQEAADEIEQLKKTNA